MYRDPDGYEQATLDDVQHTSVELADQILAEQRRHELEIVAEAQLPSGPTAPRVGLRLGTSFDAVSAMLREAMRCPVCGKGRVVLNLVGYRQRFRGEPVTAETHCQCPDSPVRQAPPPAEAC